MKTLMVFGMVLSLVFGVSAQTDLSHYGDLSEQGNALYKQGEYEEALKQYTGILEAGYFSSELYFNVANCHYKLGGIASAILYYERALKLAPSDKDIRFNLELAQAATVDEIETLPELFLVGWWRDLKHLLHIDGWAWLSIILAFGTAGLFLLFQFNRQVAQRKLLFSGALFTTFLCVFCVVIALSLWKSDFKDKWAVIFDPVITVTSEPNEASGEEFTLHEGTKVQILGEEEGWYRVGIASGGEGWLPKSALVVI